MASKPAPKAKKIKLEKDVEEADGVEMADIDSILKEKTAKGAKTYLVSWMDGAPASWVKEEDLEGTEALEEWTWKEDAVPEEFDPEHVVKRKCDQLISWLRGSKRASWLVGAGLSASAGLPTFRGTNGLWTRGAQVTGPEDSKKRKKKTKEPAESPKPEPTLAHHTLVSLEKAGFAHYVASQNYDDLLGRAGFPSAKMSELHGNIFIEVCEGCCHSYHRDFEVVLATSQNHETGRVCDQVLRNGSVCGQPLKDNIVHFDEGLPWRELTMASAKFLGSDMAIVLGSTLRVEPAASLPFRAKRRRRVVGTAPPNRCVIVNLQPTPRDTEADLVIRARCDDVMERVAAALLAEQS
jgi:NAD-dependent SIR2 family protein deacetylase